MERAYTYEVITPPAIYPISLADVKNHLKLDPNDDSQDLYLEFLICSVTKYG